jgi:glutathione peroxidase
MKKLFIVTGCLLLIISAKSFSQENAQTKEATKTAEAVAIEPAQSLEIQTNTETEMDTQSIYQFIVKDLSGKDFDFSKLKGKKIMIVNTASKCGNTPQYKDLETIYEKYKNSNLIIIGFPANNFMQQEPGTNEEIATFCTKNYGVTFPMMSKISVKGKDIAPIYQFLTQKSNNGVIDSKVEWNFQKYLINENGHLYKVIKPGVSPLNDEIIGWIKEK